MSEDTIHIDVLNAKIKELQEENADLRVQLDIANERNKKLLNTACEKMTESKRISRMMTLLDEEMAEVKKKLAASERENRNLVLWMKIQGENK